MEKQYHVLNGDALKEVFPEDIEGSIIVMRECLIDGDLNGATPEAFFETRATFLSENYGGSKQDYFDKVVTEFDKIRSISEESEVNLWFEDDLFCQVNFWFIAHLLVQYRIKNSVYLIRPEGHHQYGFGGLSETALLNVHKQRVQLNHLEAIADLWGFYRDENSQELLKAAIELEAVYPYILKAVRAHIDRIPKEGDEGRPTRSLRAIMKELNTRDFGQIFTEFNKREPIYGFGDLQVRRLLERIINA
ncbi:DUF1835 domain-containing protein [Lutimonas sp.]|uniref:DUF1835 domain-containing protein n=1 Tax=Lutimonas sp. TaxID=1872403 RepID=UPI003D9BBA49